MQSYCAKCDEAECRVFSLSHSHEPYPCGYGNWTENRRYQNHGASDVRRDDDIKFDGIVREFSSTRLFLRDGTTLLINRDTEIDGTLFVGAEVEVVAVRRGDGTLVAVEIEVEERRVEDSRAADDDEDDKKDEDDRSDNSGSGSSHDEDDEDDDEGY